VFNHQAQQGFLTLACNTSNCDYLELAYVQAMSIKIVMPKALYAIAVDAETESKITSQHRTSI